MTNPVNLSMSESEWWVLNCLFTDAADNPINIEGADEIRWAVAETFDDEALLEATLTDGQITVTDGPNGLATIELDTADHAAIVPGVYRHQCFITVNDQAISQFAGTLTVESAIA